MRPMMILTCVLVSLGLCGPAMARDWPPEMRADQCLRGGTFILEHDGPPTAGLVVEIPDALPMEFFYWDDQAQAEPGFSQSDGIQIHNGEGFLQRGLRETGREAGHYASALALLSQAEGHGLPRPQLPANEPGPSAGQPAIPEISPHVVKIARQTKIDQCDNNLWGEWVCPGGDHLILSHAFNNNGIEQVTLKKENTFIGWDEKSYTVDEKWHPDSEMGKEDNLSCNGWNKYGFRVLSILTRACSH